MKIELPVYRTKLPVNQKAMEFTPLIVKEEKNIAAAKETGGNVDGYNTLMKILEDKTGFKVKSLCETDLIHLMLEFRKKSIGEKFKTSFICPNSNERVQIDVDISDIKLCGDRREGVVQTDDLHIKLSIPNEFSDTLSAIQSIETSKEKIDFNSVSDNEKRDLLESLPVLVKNEVEETVKSFYQYKYFIDYTSADVKRRIVLSSAEDFFTLLFVM